MVPATVGDHRPGPGQPGSQPAAHLAGLSSKTSDQLQAFLLMVLVADGLDGLLAQLVPIWVSTS